MTYLPVATLRGVRDVAALLFPPPTAVERIAAEWGAGATLWRLPDGSLVLRFAEPVRRRCEWGPAVPLVDEDGRLFALPPFDASAPARSVVRLARGRLVVEPLVEWVDPAVLVDTSGWRVARPAPAPARAPARPAPSDPRPSVPEPAFDARAQLGGQPPPGERVPPRLRGMQAEAEGRRLGPVGRWLSERRKQSYLDRLTRLFAEGRVDDAVREALPLGQGPSGPPATRVPRRKDDLHIAMQRKTGGSTLGVGRGLRSELEQRYRAAAEQLEREGKILDAAYVLADLLGRPTEACAFLERHGELRLAAELCEARVDDPADAARLWWLAGDRARAVAIARRTRCFSAVVWRLERADGRDEADGVRRAWMASLLDAGDLPGAYDVGADVPGEEAAALRRRLIEVGVAEGGTVAARMLGRQLRAGDEAPHPAVVALLEDGHARREREVLAEVLAASKKVDHPAVARSLFRSLVAEQAEVTRDVLVDLLALAEDPVLKGDVVGLSRFDGRGPFPDTLWVEVDAADRGVIGVRDARVLPGRRVALALDGAGVRVVRPNGRTAAEFDVSAHALVPSDSGTHILAVRRLERGSVSVTVLDLLNRRTRVLGEVPATTWASTFDGGAWFVAAGRRLWMLDMLADGPSALWKRESFEAPVLALARDGARLAVATADATVQFSLPSLRQFRRLPPPAGYGLLLPSGEIVPAVASDGRNQATVEAAGSVTIAVSRVGPSAPSAPLAVVQLHGSSEAVVHVDDGALVVADGWGRVEVVDLGRIGRALSLRVR